MGIVKRSSSSAAELIQSVGLKPRGPVTWGDPVDSRAPGVYVIETPAPLRSAPIDESVLSAWLDRVPGLLIDGRRASVRELQARLATFWIAGETVVYVGLAGTNLRHRVGGFYRTPLGDSRPHAGGHWLKTLATLGSLLVWWTDSDDPAESENDLLAAFAGKYGGGIVLPFANRQTAGGRRKPHGISRSTLRSTGRARQATLARPKSVIHARRESTSAKAINDALQVMACGAPDHEIKAVEAARELERQGLLRDSADRPGKPLRDLLRAGLVEHAYQKDGRFWLIRCGSA